MKLAKCFRPEHCLQRLQRFAEEGTPLVWGKEQRTATARRWGHDMAASASANTDPRRSDAQGARPFHEIPGPRGLPFLGTLYDYVNGKFTIKGFHHALISRYREYGPIWRETIAGETIIHLMDPDYTKIVLQQEGKIPHIPPLLQTTQMYRQYRDLSPGLGNTNGEEWYRLRSAVQQMMMRPKAVSMFLPLVNEVADDFLKRISSIKNDQDEIPNFYNEVLKWNLESSGMTCFETRLGAIEADADSEQQRMIDANQAIFHLSLKLKFAIPWFKVISTPTWKKLVEAEDNFFGKGQKLVDQTAAKIQALIDEGKFEEGQYGFLSYLLSKRDLTYKDVSIITLSLFGDGLSTTVPTLVGQLYCLASNPDAQEKLYDEISTVVPKNVPITTDMIGKMSYLKACVKEGFRFFPIGSEVSRIPQKDLVIGGYHIPAGTHLELNHNMLLRLPEYFEDPDRYVPERWVRGESEQTTHPYLLIPFGHGPRMCAGRRFAEQEMYVVITKLLQEYKLEWRHEPMAQEYRMLLFPDQSARFTFLKRSS